jgi:hypothetical protein
MPTTSQIRFPSQNAENSLDVVEYVCIAADLLETMFSELRSLEVATRQFTRAMSSHGSEMQVRLSILRETADLLTHGTDPSTEAKLRGRATQLISWLSREINALTLCASGDECHPDLPQGATY